MRKIIFLLLFQSINFFGQANADNLVFWNSTRKLNVDDFQIKTKNGETYSSFAQFSIDYQVGGFDFLKKNFNKKVRNYFIKSASWIDTTKNVSISIRYEQTLFDLSEIYTRQFRKLLKENRKKILTGTGFIADLNQNMLTNFSNRRIIYDKETNFGQNEKKQKEWELQIQIELTDLKEFSNE
jgi:hypothetical protein